MAKQLAASCCKAAAEVKVKVSSSYLTSMGNVLENENEQKNWPKQVIHAEEIQNEAKKATTTTTMNCLFAVAQTLS